MQRIVAIWIVAGLTVLSAMPANSAFAQSKRAREQEPNRVDQGKVNKSREPAGAPSKSDRRDLGGRAPNKSRR